VTLFKEVDNLSRLGQRVPFELKIIASEARETYPLAVRVEEALRMYNRACRQLRDWSDLAPLAAVFRKKVQETLEAGVLKMLWVPKSSTVEYSALQKYVDSLVKDSVDLEEKVIELAVCVTAHPSTVCAG